MIIYTHNNKDIDFVQAYKYEYCFLSLSTKNYLNSFHKIYGNPLDTSIFYLSPIRTTKNKFGVIDWGVDFRFLSYKTFSNANNVTPVCSTNLSFYGEKKIFFRLLNTGDDNFYLDYIIILNDIYDYFKLKYMIAESFIDNTKFTFFKKYVDFINASLRTPLRRSVSSYHLNISYIPYIYNMYENIDNFCEKADLNILVDKSSEKDACLKYLNKFKRSFINRLKKIKEDVDCLSLCDNIYVKEESLKSIERFIKDSSINK